MKDKDQFLKATKYHTTQKYFDTFMYKEIDLDEGYCYDNDLGDAVSACLFTLLVNREIKGETDDEDVVFLSKIMDKIHSPETAFYKPEMLYIIHRILNMDLNKTKKDA